jgi:predicted tellurium resistance membrane protein TerC
VGVFIGILAMRFVAQGFVKLMEKFPFLETAAFLVIGLLGVKLMIDGLIHLIPQTGFGIFMEDEHNKHYIDLGVSLTTIGIFLFPILFTIIFKPKKKNPPL